MLLYVKVSDNLLRIFEKLKHSFAVKICDCRALFGISTKNKYVDLVLTSWFCKYVAGEFT